MHSKYSTRPSRGPVSERRADEQEEWNAHISELAAKVSTPLVRRQYIRHPLTHECELR